MTVISNEPEANFESFYKLLKSLDDFNEKEVKGVAFGQISPTPREQCFLGNYLRAIANVKTLLKFNNVADSQAIAMIARSVFELAIEIELIDRIPNGPGKIFSFVGYEQLRRSRKIVRFAESHPNHNQRLDVPFHKSFIDREGAQIDAERKRLWPNSKDGPLHWSQLNLRQHAELIGEKVLEMYDSEYQMHSWYAHAGLTGVLSTQAEFYWALCAIAYKLSADSYEVILKSIVRTFKLTLSDEKILDKLKYAKVVPFTEDESQAGELWKSMVGDGRQKD
jgi:Family of unknown function (DUF5677)